MVDVSTPFSFPVNVVTNWELFVINLFHIYNWAACAGTQSKLSGVRRLKNDGRITFPVPSTMEQRF